MVHLLFNTTYYLQYCLPDIKGKNLFDRTDLHPNANSRGNLLATHSAFSTYWYNVFCLMS